MLFCFCAYKQYSNNNVKEGKEGNVLFNDALNTFYLRLYGVRRMIKDHSARKETRCSHMGYSFQLAARFFYMHHPTDRIIHTTAFVIPVVELWLERKIAQWVHPMKDRSDDPSYHKRTRLPRSYISLPFLQLLKQFMKLNYFINCNQMKKAPPEILFRQIIKLPFDLMPNMLFYMHHPTDRIAHTAAFVQASENLL